MPRCSSTCNHQRLEPRPDRLRQLAGLRHPVVLRPEDVQREPRRRGAAGRRSTAPEVERRRHEAGPIGVGTWRTQAEFKDIKVTRGDETLFACDFADGTKGWRLHGGDWTVEDGALQQTSAGRQHPRRCRRQGLDRLHLQPQGPEARRRRRLPDPLPGPGRGSQKSWWNIGGWGNTRHAIEMGGDRRPDVPGRIETGRWYDIRIELQGANIKCYLDGKLIHDVKLPAMKSLYASATRVQSTGEVILKVVNASSHELATDVALRRAGQARRTGVRGRADLREADRRELARASHQGGPGDVPSRGCRTRHPPHLPRQLGDGDPGEGRLNTTSIDGRESISAKPGCSHGTGRGAHCPGCRGPFHSRFFALPRE